MNQIYTKNNTFPVNVCTCINIFELNQIVKIVYSTSW